MSAGPKQMTLAYVEGRVELIAKYASAGRFAIAHSHEDELFENVLRVCAEEGYAGPQPPAVLARAALESLKIKFPRE